MSLVLINLIVIILISPNYGGLPSDFDNNFEINSDKTNLEENKVFNLKDNFNDVWSDHYSNQNTRLYPSQMNDTIPSNLHLVFEYKLIKTIEENAWVNSVAWSPDNTMLASGNSISELHIWNTSDWTLITSKTSHGNAISSVSWSPDGKLLATGSLDATVIIWNTTTWLQITTLTGHSNIIYSITWSPDGSLLASGSQDMTAIVWNSTTWLPEATLIGHTAWIMHVAFEPDGSLFASSSVDQTIILWNTTDWSNYKRLSSHNGAVLSMEWSRDGSLFASGSMDFSLIIWNTTNWEPLYTLTPFTNGVSAIFWSYDGTLLVSGSFDSQIIIWNTTNFEILEKLDENSELIISVSLNDNDRSLASGSVDEWILIYNLIQFNFENINEAITLQNSILKIDIVNRFNRTTYKWNDNPALELMGDQIITPSTLGWHELTLNIGGYEYKFTFYITNNLTDFDNDGLPNDFENQFNLNLYYDDSLLDSDDDGVLNLDEYELGINPSNKDTDEDGMSDGYELTHNLNPAKSNQGMDTDGDSILDVFEHDIGTDPSKPDTDGDGMSDGYELKHDLDPTKSNKGKDSDGDLLPDIFEHDIGTDPSNPKETIIFIFSIVILISVIFFSKQRNKKRNKEAIGLGYTDYKQKKEVTKYGFNNLEDKLNAENNGFLHKEAETLSIDNGYSSTRDFKDSLIRESELIQPKINSIVLQTFIEEIENSKSPINLREIEIKNKKYIEDILQHKYNLIKFSTMLEKFISLQKDVKVPLFIDLDNSQLNLLNQETNSSMEAINEFKNEVDKAIKQQKQWFEPWEALLTLIQMTEDGIPADLTTIAEVVNFPKKQVESLIQLLLKENPLIGSYDEAKKIYEKGAEIEKYIVEMLNKMKGLELKKSE